MNVGLPCACSLDSLLTAEPRIRSEGSKTSAGTDARFVGNRNRARRWPAPASARLLRVTRAERERSASHTTGIWTPLTSFVGRADEAAELSRLLEDNRLVTVTGPGGVGKTRLATELARRVQDRFPDGAWFIELGAAAEAAQVPDEVMSALGVRQDPAGRPLRCSRRCWHPGGCCSSWTAASACCPRSRG